MKTKFIYVVLMALFFGKPDDPFCTDKENKERKTASYTGADDADADQSDGESAHAG